jgi:hypothetical protein
MISNSLAARQDDGCVSIEDVREGLLQISLLCGLKMAIKMVVMG